MCWPEHRAELVLALKARWHSPGADTESPLRDRKLSPCYYSGSCAIHPLQRGRSQCTRQPVFEVALYWLIALKSGMYNPREMMRPGELARAWLLEFPALGLQTCIWQMSLPVTLTGNLVDFKGNLWDVLAGQASSQLPELQNRKCLLPSLPCTAQSYKFFPPQTTNLCC